MQSEVLEPKDYVNYVKAENNGLKVNQQVGNLVFSAQYKPSSYIAITERLNPSEATAGAIDSIENQLEGMQYFNFRIKSTEAGVDLLKLNWDGSQEQYLAKGDYLTFQINQDFTLIHGDTELKCQAFHFPRHYNMAPTLDFVLGFEIKDIQHDLELIYNDRLFGMGKFRFKILKEDINELPTLQLRA